MTELVLTVGILQLLIPLVLLFWQWRQDAPGMVRWLAKTALASGYFILIAIAVPWLLLPVVLPYLFLGASVLLGIRGFRRRRHLPLQRAARPRDNIEVGFTALLALLVWSTALYALSGWRMPATGTAHLAFPLRDGVYYIANGGSTVLSNAHLKTLDGDRFRAYRGQSFGVDIVQVNRYGLRANGILPADPSNYVIFGTPVYAPCAGKVVAIDNMRNDLSPPQMDKTTLAGNHVILDCGEHIVLLAHFKRGSVQVAVGQHVEVGRLLAMAGNSGNSGEPHLHIHAQRRGSHPAALDGDPLWPVFDDGQFLARNRILVR